MLWQGDAPDSTPSQSGTPSSPAGASCRPKSPARAGLSLRLSRLSLRLSRLALAHMITLVPAVRFSLMLSLSIDIRKSGQGPGGTGYGVGDRGYGMGVSSQAQGKGEEEGKNQSKGEDWGTKARVGRCLQALHALAPPAPAIGSDPGHVPHSACARYHIICEAVVRTMAIPTTDGAAVAFRRRCPPVGHCQ